MDLVWLWFAGLLIYSLGLILALRVAWVGFELSLSFMLYLLPLNAGVLIVSLLLGITNAWAGGGVFIFVLANLAWLARIVGWAWVRPGKTVDSRLRGSDKGVRGNDSEGDLKVCIGFMNVLEKNQRYADIGQRIQELGLDVVGLAEMNPDGFAVLKQASGLTHSYISSGNVDPSDRELAVVSRWPIARATIVGKAHQKLLQVQLKTAAGAWQVLVFHPYPPFTARWLKRRNQVLAELATITQAATIPTIIMGDFNTVPWAPALIRLRRHLANHYHAGQGRGLYHTWQRGPLRLPIDYIWLPCRLPAGSLQLDRFMGSDHRLVWIQIEARGS
ncbi:MAG TPA: endonuclease/exonuclease/phosphatase family protein [Candidatus Saccharimonadales bacterium]|nr:endonuclease/exonuclease/phosphatase family protein [Candidatus Saccharimonadales bacterium]